MVKHENNPQMIVAHHMGSDAAILFTGLLNQKPEHADAIVFLQGDRLDRVQKVRELYESGFANTVFITGNNELVGRGKRNEENDMHLSELKGWLVGHGIPEKVMIIDDQSMNTSGQAINTIRLAKEKGWPALLVVTSPFHVLRAYLTFLKQANKQGWKGHIIMQVADLPWGTPPSGRTKTAKEMLAIEMEKIKKYAKDIATIEESRNIIV